jgi:hypothetical protein
VLTISIIPRRRTITITTTTAAAAAAAAATIGAMLTVIIKMKR